jgi:hypothetical protein
MAAGWTIEPLKEYFEKILEERDRAFAAISAEKDKALAAALIAVKEENRKTELGAEKRFELLNELRSGVATKDQMEALEKRFDEIKARLDKGEGRSEGYSKFIGWIVAAVAVAGLLAKYL